jgi:hypothetical protein
VSYYENLADDLAERVYKVIYNDFGRTVYVNHIVRDKMPGYFEANIENIIRNCKVFILVNTRGALSRPRVIKEVKTAFPDGNLFRHEPWVFRQDSDDVPYGTDEFREEAKIDPELVQQSPFSLMVSSDLNGLRNNTEFVEMLR